MNVSAQRCSASDCTSHQWGPKLPIIGRQACGNGFVRQMMRAEQEGRIWIGGRLAQWAAFRFVWPSTMPARPRRGKNALGTCE